MMEYKGYFGGVVFDAENNVFHGEVVGVRDVITFQGKSVSELRRAFRDSVDDYLEFCRQRGESPTNRCRAASCFASPPNCIGRCAPWRPRPGKASTPGSLHA